MTTGSVAGAFGALLFVLALLGAVLHLLRRLTNGRLTGASTVLPLAVLRRLPLGPRQGLAVVRIGTRVVVISTGEGGVHHLLDLEAAESESLLTPVSTRAPLSLVSHATFHPVQAAASGNATFVERLREAMRNNVPSLAIIAALALGVSHSSAAQDSTAQRPPNPPVSAAPQVPPVVAPAPVAAPDAQAATNTPPAARQAAPRTRPLYQGQPQQTGFARLPGPIPPVRGRTSSQSGNAGAPQLDVRFGSGTDGGLHLSGTVGTIVMLGLLAMLPTLVLLMTSFTRILIVLQLLRQALGTQSAPPAHLIAAFALLLTGFVMSPTISEIDRTAIEPWLQGKMEQTEMLQTAVGPLRQFMLRQTRDQDIATFVDMSGAKVTRADAVPLPVLVSAFATSELRAAFQIGFVLFLPFIIIDIVVAAVLMSMGMFMLPPAMISLPFKLLLFVLVDGWTLIVQSLVASFH